MSRQSAPDVVGVAEVATLAQVSKGRVSQWRAAGIMPPATELSGGPVWRRRHITEWLAARRVAR